MKLLLSITLLMQCSRYSHVIADRMVRFMFNDGLPPVPNNECSEDEFEYIDEIFDYTDTSDRRHRQLSSTTVANKTKTYEQMHRDMRKYPEKCKDNCAGLVPGTCRASGCKGYRRRTLKSRHLRERQSWPSSLLSSSSQGMVSQKHREEQSQAPILSVALPTESTWECYKGTSNFGSVKIWWGHAKGDGAWACNAWKQNSCGGRCEARAATSTWGCYYGRHNVGMVTIWWGHAEGDAAWACNAWRPYQCWGRCKARDPATIPAPSCDAQIDSINKELDLLMLSSQISASCKSFLNRSRRNSECYDDVVYGEISSFTFYNMNADKTESPPVMDEIQDIVPNGYTICNNIAFNAGVEMNACVKTVEFTLTGPNNQKYSSIDDTPPMLLFNTTIYASTYGGQYLTPGSYSMTARPDNFAEKEKKLSFTVIAC